MGWVKSYPVENEQAIINVDSHNHSPLVKDVLNIISITRQHLHVMNLTLKFTGSNFNSGIIFDND